LENIENTYKENYLKMYRLAMKMIHDESVTDDIVQEVFVYYFEKTQNGYRVDNPSGWLARATMNKCVDHLKYREKFTQLTPANEQATEERSFEINKTEAILKQAISKLKPIEMKIVLLYSEEYSYKEIAGIAKINFSSVWKTLSRTLQKLKEILKKMDYEMY
jgi:RNA polymerase sigma-70 factor (ECF subfamily)